MKMTTPWMMTLALASTVLAAGCTAESDDALDCGAGEAVELNGASYCVFRGPVTETGFSCPAEVPNLIPGELSRICAAEPDLSQDAIDMLLSRTSGGVPDETVLPPGSDEPTGWVASGSVSLDAGASLPASQTLTVLWSVTSGSPDYIYALGSGMAEPGGFTIELPTTPPEDILNSGELAVGVVVGLRQAVPEGQVSDSITIEGNEWGATDRYAIIYRKPGTQSFRDWALAFPEGYSCGRGIATNDSIFEGFEPVDCADVVLRILGQGGTYDYVNWS